MLFAHRFRKVPGFVQIRHRGLTPQQIGIRRISDTARDRLIQAGFGAVKAFRGTFAGNKRRVIRIHIGRQQVRGVRVGACKNDRRRIADVRGQTRGDQFLDGFLRRHQHLAAHVSAFLHRRQLIFKMNTRRTGVDHRFH